MSLRSIPLRDLLRDVVAEVEGTPATKFDITVTNGRRRVSFTEEHPCWHAALTAAFDKYGIPSVVSVRPHREPEERAQFCLV